MEIVIIAITKPRVRRRIKGWWKIAECIRASLCRFVGGVLLAVTSGGGHRRILEFLKRCNTKVCGPKQCQSPDQLLASQPTPGTWHFQLLATHPGDMALSTFSTSLTFDFGVAELAGSFDRCRHSPKVLTTSATTRTPILHLNEAPVCLLARLNQEHMPCPRVGRGCWQNAARGAENR